jgi:hypothetical protein
MSEATTPNTEMPKYRQMNPHGFFADDDTLYPEGTEFYWGGEPNEFMEPLNQPALEAMNKYTEYLDECARKYAEKMGRPFMGRTKSFAETYDQLLEDAKTIAAEKDASKRVKKIKLTAPKKPNVQGHLDANGQMIRRRPGRPPKIAGAVFPEPPKAQEPKPIQILGKDFTDTLPNRG